ncbi:MAG: transketolase C-terminal domain-containing protein, partial [Dokdonella sp.]
ELILSMARSHDAIVTIEENAIAGGVGSAITELLACHDVVMPVLQLGLADSYLEHASREELLAQSGLDAAGIESAIRTRFADRIASPARRSAG